MMIDIDKMSFCNCEWRSFPHCPKCDSPDYDWWESTGGRNAMDVDVWKVHCYDCNIDYAVAACMDISFASKEIDDE